ncbi:MAG: UvrD-helicase domain-containing protein [Brachymonas sp.]
MTAAYTLAGKPCTREAFYAAACDPQRHIVVQACAGAGKTWMLVSRILRALIAGAQPQEILAITFTKKAAGEMRERLQEWLLEFSSACDERLTQALLERGISSEIAHSPAHDLRSLLSNLYRAILQSPRGVQIRTFHGWFAALLRHAPLDVLEQLQLPAQYELLEDDAQAVQALWPRFYALLQGDAALHAIYREAVCDVGRWGVQEALTNALAKRVEFELADRAGVVRASIPSAADVFPEFAGLDEPLQRLAMQQAVLLAAARVLGAAKQASYAAKGQELEQCCTEARWGDALLCLLTQEGTPRKFNAQLVSTPQVAAAQALCEQVKQANEQHAAWQHQQRMAQLSRALIACFADLKRERGWVDMNDLERAALHLLADDALSGWVQQRLDAQVRHLLIDEFQDTNPLQWQALQAWLSGYAGVGGGGHAAPSVFIVGDAKQSIYRFRRAEPQVFEAATRFVCHELNGTLLQCDHTRRNAQGVMQVVNALMTQAATELPYEFRVHTTESLEAGQVIRLPLAPLPEKALSSGELVWRDTLTTPRDEPEEHAVDTECQVAARWVAAQIAGGLAGQDIMVLARKRDRLARMRDALRSLGVVSQITEKTALIDLPEVQDMVALLDALVSPGNDLALARALKSPLLGWSDEDLMALAQDVKAARSASGHATSWWQVLTRTLSDAEHSAQILCRRNADLTLKTADALRQMQALLQQLPPHDALSRIMSEHHASERFMAAAPAPLRARVQLSLQALLHAALEIGAGRFLTPHAFVRALKAPHLKAPQAAASTQAVRLMTIHGAKGLEAHTVLLLDTLTGAAQSHFLDVLVDWPGAAPHPQTFAFLRSEAQVPACVGPALAHEREQRAREEINTLYVAMTRTKQRLVFSAHEMARQPSEGCPWMRLQALPEPEADLIEEAWHGDFAAPPVSHAASVFLMKKLPFAGMESAQIAMQFIASNKPSPEEDLAARIGMGMHRLLELYQPQLDLQPLTAMIAASLQLSAEQAAQALQAAQRMVQGEAAWVWSDEVIDWQANEVELLHAGQLLRLDRLVRRRDTGVWWVIDYKSARNPQQSAALRAQLLGYGEAVKAAMAHENAEPQVKTAFITAEGRWVALE